MSERQIALTAAQRAAVEYDIERLIALLDAADGDPDFEPDSDGEEPEDDESGRMVFALVQRERGERA